MLEYPIVQEVVEEAVAKKTHEIILIFLKERFGPLSQEVVEELRTIKDEEKLQHLVQQAALCPDLNSWRTHLRP